MIIEHHVPVAARSQTIHRERRSARPEEGKYKNGRQKERRIPGGHRVLEEGLHHPGCGEVKWQGREHCAEGEEGVILALNWHIFQLYG